MQSFPQEIGGAGDFAATGEWRRCVAREAVLIALLARAG